MDEMEEPAALDPPPELLSSLLKRVTELERQVAALRAAPAAPPLPPAAPPMPGAAPRAAPQQAPQRSFRPLPQPLQRLAGEPGPEAAAKPAQSLENRLGSQVFNRIGIVALLFASSWALKLAIEQGWIGPVGRVLIGLGAGAGLVLWSERFRRNGFAAFSYSLKAVGTGVLYLTLWAAFRLYHLLPASAALGAMILVTAWNAFMAWSQDSELLAAYALTGAFATPVLLSTGGNHEVFLFTYIAAIDVATLALVRLKPWPRLLLATLIGTVGFYIGWYASFYEAPSRFSQNPDQPFGLTVAYTLLFFVLFALPSIKGFLSWSESASPLAPDAGTRLSRSPAILSVLIPLGNAAFGSLALYSLFEDSNLHDALPWLMAGFAAVYLGLMRLQRSAVSAALHLALAVVFLTVAIPLKASGHTLTIAWLVEGLALLWASTRIPQPPEGSPELELLAPAAVLRLLSFVGYTLGFLALCFTRFWWMESGTPSFWNADLGSALVGLAVFAGAAALGLSAVLAGNRPYAWLAVAWSDFLALDAIALLLTLREIVASEFTSALHPAFANAEFATALVGLATLAASAYTLGRLAGNPLLERLQSLAAATFILFNLATILTVEREIGALWPRYDANLQRSLAISAFLMLYGAALLALGFVKRSAFTRWQALVLLLFTIAKVFLYDMSGLSQGYRVASFLALGVLLMAVSFAYQKDWLNLKSPAPPPETAPQELESREGHA
jgi:uncharacterized membrane protein